jgi:hypothetical protein
MDLTVFCALMFKPDALAIYHKPPNTSPPEYKPTRLVTPVSIITIVLIVSFGIELVFDL